MDFVGIGKIVIITLLFMIIDIVTGYIGAWVSGTVSSAVMRNGLAHKFTFVAFVCMAALIDYAQGEGIINLGGVVQLTTMTCIYIIITEINSITENAVIMFPELTNTPLVKMFRNSTSLMEQATKENEEVHGKHVDRKPELHERQDGGGYTHHTSRDGRIPEGNGQHVS